MNSLKKKSQPQYKGKKRTTYRTSARDTRQMSNAKRSEQISKGARREKAIWRFRPWEPKSAYGSWNEDT